MVSPNVGTGINSFMTLIGREAQRAVGTCWGSMRIFGEN
jgi:hypothetical protein